MKLFKSGERVRYYVNEAGEIWKEFVGWQRPMDLVVPVYRAVDGLLCFENVPVHEIVARQYVPNAKGLPVLRFIDGDKGNVCASNLGWFKERKKHGGVREGQGRKKKYTQDVINEIVEMREVDKMTEESISSFTGMTKGVVHNILRNQKQVSKD